MRKVLVHSSYRKDDKNPKRAWFHCFAQVGDTDGSDSIAIVEYEDGRVENPYSCFIQFVNPGSDQ